MYEIIKDVDPAIYAAIIGEIKRQAYTLELIASENFISEEVLATMGCPMTNKYAEGYPKKRYYGGCEYVDSAEELAIKRAKELFGCDHANVQPHSGTQANIAAYLAVLDIGDTVLGMNLSHGGHLSHGHPVNFSGKYFNVIQYGVDEESEVIDYDSLLELAKEVKPSLIIAGASAYPRTLDFPAFRKVVDEVSAILLVDIAHIAGLIVADVHPSPIPYADIVTTTTHKTLRGPRAGMIMCKEEYAKVIDKSVFPGNQGGPMMHIIAAKAVCFKEAMEPEFNEYQQQIVKNAKTLARTLAEKGLRIVSDGTDTHLMLVDVRPLNLTGKDAEEMLEESGITVNKNTIPYDPESPFVTSGIRIGTPALTTRGMKEEEMKKIGGLIYEVLSNPEDEGVREKVRDKVLDLCVQFPLYEKFLRDAGEFIE